MAHLEGATLRSYLRHHVSFPLIFSYFLGFYSWLLSQSQGTNSKFRLHDRQARGALQEEVGFFGVQAGAAFILPLSRTWSLTMLSLTQKEIGNCSFFSLVKCWGRWEEYLSQVDRHLAIHAVELNWCLVCLQVLTQLQASEYLYGSSTGCVVRSWPKILPSILS